MVRYASTPPLSPGTPHRQSNRTNDSSSSSSLDSVNYLQYLEKATAKNPAILLELDLDGNIRYVSQIWESVVGKKCADILGKPISDIIIGCQKSKQVFQKAISMMCEDDRSYRVRFLTATRQPKKMDDMDALRPASVMDTGVDPTGFNDEDDDRTERDTLQLTDTHTEIPTSDADETTADDVIELEAQGTLLHNNDNENIPTHTMWIVKPSYDIDELHNLPPDFVKRLGFGAKLFSQYLQQIEELCLLDEQDLPAPKCELCRVCETLVPAWWLETHSEMCVCEHRIESTVQLLHDELVELKRLIENISKSLKNGGAITEYKGIPLPKPDFFRDNHDIHDADTNTNDNDIFCALYPSEGMQFFSTSNVTSTCVDSVSKSSSASPLQPLNFPFKSLKMLSDLCEDAININTSELYDLNTQTLDSPYGIFNGQSAGYRFSPNSKSNIDHITSWNPHWEISDPAINQLTEDTVELIKRKVESVLRLDNAMRYSLKIKNEIDSQVLQLIKDKIQTNKINLQSDVLLPDLCEKAHQAGFSDSSSPVSTRIATPLPQRPQSRILAGEFMESDDIAALKSVHETVPTLEYTSRSNSGSHPLSRSITPRQSAVEPSPTNAFSLSMSTVGANSSGQHTDGKIHNVSTPKAASISLGTLPKLATIINLTPRRGSPLSSVGMNTPLSSVQRKSLAKNPEKSPMSSPFMIGTDFLSPEIHLPYGSAPKPPLSPLLLATNQSKSSTPSIKDYDIIKPISKGAYGSVYLAYKRITGEYFAIKVLRKSDMIAKNQVTNVKSERVIMMVQSEKPYVAKLYATFQNKEYLFLVMEYLSGGDLATLIKMMGNLPDKWAKQYISEVIIGVDDMHLSGIIHHDLKPDNLLIDSNGHIKLTDFGLSRMGLIRRHKKKHSRQYSLLNPPGKSRTNSITPEDPLDNGLVPVAMSSIAQSNNLDGHIVARRIERSDSISSSHSQLEPQTLHRTGSQVSFSMLDVSRSGTPPCPLQSQLQPSQEQQQQQQQQQEQQQQQKQQQQQQLLVPSSSGSIPKRSASVMSSDASDTCRDLALFHPDEDVGRRFFGTPDYLSPETILGTGESDSSDWWSVGCILFEFLLGYPPFHASAVEDVFKNILNCRIDWPEFSSPEAEHEFLTPEAKDVITRLLVLDPEKRLGANGAQEIREHPYFRGINWEKVYEEEASFVPTLGNPEDTDYFDLRGADLDDLLRDNYGEELPSANIWNTPNLSMRADKKHTSNNSSGTSTPVPKMSVSSVFDTLTQDNSNSNGSSAVVKHIPLAIPPHLRERRPSKLNDIQTEFGSFSYRNLSALDKANKDAINRLKSEHYSDHAHTRNSPGSLSSSSSETSGKLKVNIPASSASSPICSITPGCKGQGLRSSSPQMARTNSPSRRNSTEQAANCTSAFTQRTHNYDQQSLSETDYQSSPSPSVTKFKSPLSPTQNVGTSRSHMHSRTSSQRTSVSEMSMDDEERQAALTKVNTLRVRRRSGRKSSSGISDVGYKMDVLLCEPIPIHRYRLTKDLESLGCSVVAVGTGDEIIRRATSGVRFDLIITALKLQKVGALDIARLLRHTNSVNCSTPIVAVAVNYQDASNSIFDEILERPIGMEQLRKLISRYALYKSQKHEETILSDSEI